MRLRRLLFGGPRTPEEEAENEARIREEEEKKRLEEEERKRKEEEARQRKAARGLGGYFNENPGNKKALDEAGDL